MWREGRRIQPFASFGAMLKKSERCDFDGDLDCNRVVPLPFCFLSTLGARIGDVLITVSHCSNDGLDSGPEKKNLGEDFIRAEVWF